MGLQQLLAEKREEILKIAHQHGASQVRGFSSVPPKVGGLGGRIIPEFSNAKLFSTRLG